MAVQFQRAARATLAVVEGDGGAGRQRLFGQHVQDAETAEILQAAADGAGGGSIQRAVVEQGSLATADGIGCGGIDRAGAGDGHLAAVGVDVDAELLLEDGNVFLANSEYADELFGRFHHHPFSIVERLVFQIQWPPFRASLKTLIAAGRLNFSHL